MILGQFGKVKQYSKQCEIYDLVECSDDAQSSVFLVLCTEKAWLFSETNPWKVYNVNKGYYSHALVYTP